MPMKHYEKMIKEKKIGIVTSVEVVNLDSFFGRNEFKKKISRHIYSILPNINTEDLSGWSLQFHINFMCTNFVAISKQLRRYPSDTQYEVPILIAIPDNTQVQYGMPPAAHGRVGFFRAQNEKYVHLLEPEYEKYENMDQYIEVSAIKAINLGFTRGFTCKGKKIKFQNM